MSECVTGYIDHIIFRNEDNGYTVMVLKGVKDEDELTCVGTFPVITQGASVEAEGSFIQHPVYGQQFQAVRLTEKMPEDAMAMERYLGSGAIKGIGAALAGRIVRHFGSDTLRIVEEEPERLAEIKGISEKKAHEIAIQIAEKSEMRKVMMFLQKYGISLNLGAKIYQKYGDSVYSVLQENPYRLADDISGVGFKIADEIAKLSLRSEKTKAGTPYIWETVYKMPDGTNGLIRWEDQRIVFQPLDDFKTNAEGIRTIPNHQCRALTRKEYQAIPFLCSDEKEALPEIL